MTQWADSTLTMAVLEHCLDGMLCQCSADLDRVIQITNSGCYPMTGYAEAELTGSRAFTLMALTHPEDRSMVRAQLAAALEFGAPYRLEYRLLSADGLEKWVIERGICPLDGGDGNERQFHVFLEDIMARVDSQNRRVETEIRYRSIFENSVVGVFQSADDGRYLAVNQALADLYGFATPVELMAGIADIAHGLYVDPGRRNEFRQLIRAHGRVVDFESEVRCANGETIWISENAWAVLDPQGQLRYYEGMVSDVTERRGHQAMLQFQATHDPLTGLPNRNQLPQRLSRACGAPVALAFLDIDNFKVINDSLGHARGDELLVCVAKRLQDALRRTDTVARYGGDEFVLLFQYSASHAEVIQTLERAMSAVQAPLQLGDHVLHISCSMGVALYPEDATDLAGLLRIADIAMYEAKARGKGLYRFHTQALSHAAQERFSLEASLRSALDAGEIRVYFQPKVDIHEQVCGCEALARWHSAVHGLVTPDRFIPMAEETGLILPLGWQILRMACQAAARWPTLHGKALSVAVNLSARQLSSPVLVHEVKQALALSGLLPTLLDLEITESMLMDDVERTIGVLHELRGLGVRIAVDDFGTGYSSLSYLKRLPIDVLKIDRSFVDGCQAGDGMLAIPSAIIFLGKALNLRIVAEGVEMPEQLDRLRQSGCDEFQGYHIARPMDHDATLRFLAGRDTRQGVSLAASGA